MNNVQIMLIILNSVNIEEYTIVFFLGKAYILDYVSALFVNVDTHKPHDSWCCLNINYYSNSQ
jgi:hypothetical protein